MNKVKITVMSAIAAMCIVVGCTKDQEKAVATQLGIASAVTWIGTDNPTTNNIVVVKQVTTFIKNVSTNLGKGTSYYVVLYPLADSYIKNNIHPSQQLVARIGAAWLLTGVDTAYTMNLSWYEKAEVADTMMNSFCDGFIVGLSMAPTDPIYTAASRQVTIRAQALNVK